jgi:hypothetical protein
VVLKRLAGDAAFLPPYKAGWKIETFLLGRLADLSVGLAKRARFLFLEQSARILLWHDSAAQHALPR